MERHKFKVSKGFVDKVLVLLVGAFLLCLPFVVIVLGIIRKEEALQVIGICVLALVFFAIPGFFMLGMIRNNLIVDGTQFTIRSGFQKEYRATCEDLKKVYCYKDRNNKGLVTYYLSITFADEREYTASFGEKNFKQLAKYFCEMQDAGLIPEGAIRPKDRRKLLQYSLGEFGSEKKSGTVIYQDGVYETNIRITPIRDKEAIRILLPFPIHFLCVMASMVLMAQVDGIVTFLIFAATLLSIIPIIIVFFVKVKKFGADVKYTNKTVVFKVSGEKVYMDGKKVSITANPVTGLFNINRSKLEGFIVEASTTGEFRAFLDRNGIPYDEFGEEYED